MRLLIVKTSSLGDVIHCLPAISDAQRAIPDVRVDWVVEEAYASIPAWHRAVDRVLPIALRRWGRAPFREGTARELLRAARSLRHQRYDLVIDCQGLLKSAVVACLARGPRVGFDVSSAREPLAAGLYARSFPVTRDAHAIDRLRALVAQALDLPVPTGPPDFGLDRAPRPRARPRPFVVFLHGTTWASKRWPEAAWAELARLATAHGVDVLVPAGDAAEAARAQRIAAGIAGAECLPPGGGLAGVAALLGAAAGVVAVDTGLAHLAGALGAPMVALYGPTDTALTGPTGPRQRVLTSGRACAPCLLRACPLPPEPHGHPPCLADHSPGAVWAALAELASLGR